MPLKVLIVDDSSFFRNQLKRMLDVDPALTVVDTAANGREAVDKVMALHPDVITMDVEMPVMDGISAVKAIMARRPTPILMFSSVTHDGAQATLDALQAGAVDFLPKKFDAIARDHDEVGRLLRERVRTIGRRAGASLRRAGAPQPPPRPASRPEARRVSRRPQLVVIGTSTGGPVALQAVLTRIPAGYPFPMLLLQHMPAGFTGAFAERLNQLCRIEVREARDNDPLRPGLALLAPGGQQTTVINRHGSFSVRVEPGDPNLRYKPSVDLSFTSAAEQVGGAVLAVVLTGMGADGREGARALKGKGAEIWAQDEATSVVYGMPMAVKEAGLADQVLPLNEVGTRLAQVH